MKNGRIVWGDELKILHIKVNANLDQSGYDKIRKRIEDELNNGFLITDNVIQAEVLEINFAGVEEALPDSHQGITPLKIGENI